MPNAVETKKVLAILTKDSWYFVRQSGSHKQYKHPTKKNTVTIAISKKMIPIGTVNNILEKQAQIGKYNEIVTK